MELVGSATNIVSVISQPWHWAVSGAAIALVMLLLTWMGRSFGLSTTFAVACSTAGAGKVSDFFKNFSWKEQDWRMVFAFGAILGGYIASHFLQAPEPLAISDATTSHLQEWGIQYPATVSEGAGFIPEDLLNFQNLKGILIAIIGGFLVGFGARYADGCTSGHAISGLSHLQLPSLLTVIGFFIGGLAMTHLMMPLIFG